MDRSKKKEPALSYDLGTVVSVTECTGLMPSLPQDEDEDENYASLIATHDTRQEKPRGCDDIPSSPA